MNYELRFSEGEYKEYTQITITDRQGNTACVQVGPVPFCCGATMICGIDGDWELDSSEYEQMVFEVLTDYDYWAPLGQYFCCTADREAQVAGLLCRSKLMFIDVVGGEEGGPSLSRMAQTHGKFQLVGTPQENANSNNDIAIYELNQEGECQI